MVAICSDLDETPDAETYFEIARFLNTTHDTRMGTGVGLEVGNTIYFRMPPDQFAFENASGEDREKVFAMIRSGHIDCIHSFGDMVTTRAEVAAYWDLLSRHGAVPEVWIDHARAPTNFDPGIMAGEGAIVGSEAYHADISLEAGIRYVWKGRVTSAIAKECPISVSGIYNVAHPLTSAVTIAKEVTKIALARLGSTKYAMHGRPDLLSQSRLASGHEVLEFIRNNPSWGGVSHNETGDGLGEVLSERLLDALVSAGGVSVFYTHLGKTGSDTIFPPCTVAALRRLSDYARDGRILVTTTRRVLGYVHATREANWNAHVEGDRLVIEVRTVLPDSDLQGMSWKIPSNIHRARAAINDGTPVDMIVGTESNERIASIPWAPLDFPEV